MKTQLIGMMVVFVAIVAIAYILNRKTVREPFESVSCPTEAVRGPDGRIQIKPGNKVFQTMSDYVSYLKDIYGKGAQCVPPKVRSHREPVPGLFGGLGNGAEPPRAANMMGTTRNVLDSDASAEETSAHTPINKLDDYEYSRVFEVERGSRNALSAAVKNDLLEKRATDWSMLPFNSEARAQQEDEFIAGRMDNVWREPKSGVFFKNMEGESTVPPDVEAAKLREQKILASYRPTEVSEHIVDNETQAVANLVNKMYKEDPNWEPVVSKTGENQWEVTELRPKARKETYEDAQTVTTAMAENGRGQAQPEPVMNIFDRLQDDPYFDKRGVSDKNNDRFWNYKDFNKWTPGLERMFAPTMDNKEWH
jgi:hypothetical protein